MQIPSYSLLTPTSDYSISATRKEQIEEKMKKAYEGKVGARVEVTLRPDSFDDASLYLGDLVMRYTDEITISLNFKENIEQKMQDKLNTPNLHLLEQKQNNSFGGYATDEYGFMGEEFLKVANLPSDYKIHKNVLQAIYDVSTIPVARLHPEDIHAEYDSIDLIAGISYAYKELQNLTKGNFDSKEAYSENEINQMVSDDWDSTFNTALMQDYTNEKGEFKKEGILLTYAYRYDTFAKAQSPFTKLSEYGKFMRGMPSSYTPNTKESDKKPKTPEELRKEMLDKLGEVYLKILENTKEIENKDSLESINGFINDMIREKGFYESKSDNVLVVEIEK